MTRLQSVLVANAASCVGFGALFLLWPTGVSGFLGKVPPGVLVLLGIGLIGNGLHLAYAAKRGAGAAEVLWFSLLDLGWWLGSLGLVASGMWVVRPGGVAACLVVAVCVAALGLVQLFELGRGRAGRSGAAHLRAIGRSWLVLPRWVKVWLWGLNALFLLSPVFLPWAEAQVVLLAYVASGPLLAAFAFVEGGLSRAMGLAHLIPWAPLPVWLAGWGAQPYAGVLAAAVAICLAFDLYDLARWLRGDRAVMGSG
ncbi:hypothetical protein [Roseobacter sp. HKCCA0434]|uniref:hypothetical protein n=1 Tax=Roseobacter sp. HKCCA0434 TaxID=3079297 RepID=UPI002905F74E|nr:hypothetical protein [Roseobacter sp. HKCCA0434]